MEPDRREVLDVLQRQLERMRGMLYGYYSQFFTALHVQTVIVISIVALSLLPQMRMLILVLPFYIVHSGAYNAFLMSYNIFARVYAESLENKINQIVGGEYLVASRMENEYIYRIASPKIVAVDLKEPAKAISLNTINEIYIGLIILAIGIHRSVQILPTAVSKFPFLHLYWPLLAVYIVYNAAWILWHFVTAAPEKRIKKNRRRRLRTLNVSPPGAPRGVSNPEDDPQS